MPYLNFVYLLRMNSSKWAIGVSFLSYFLLVTDIQGQNWEHSISLGYTFSELKNISQVPDGTSQSGTLHIAEDPRGKSGANIAYGLNFPIGKMFYASSGIGLTWLRSGFIYSRRIYGLSCSACQIATQSERLGIDATYSNFYLRIPLSVSIPFSEKGRTFLKVGADLMWQVKDNSSWEFLEVTWQYQRLDSAWFSQILQTEVLQETLETTRLQRGVFLSIWNKFAIKEEIFLLEGTLQIGLNRVDKFPALKRLSYGLQVGYQF